jgi:hypothetical protein
LRAAVRTISILGQVLRNKALSTERPERVALMEQVLNIGRRLLGHVYGWLTEIDDMVAYIQRRLWPFVVDAERQRLAAEQSEAAQKTIDPATVRLTLKELRPLYHEATGLARRFWFDLYWMASLGTINRLASAIGSKDLDPTLALVRDKDDALPLHLVQLAVRLNRRGRHIPAEDLVQLHKELKKDGNRMSRVVLEGIAWQRLLLFETDMRQRQQICEQMNIDVPKKTLDYSRKKFSPSRVNVKKK